MEQLELKKEAESIISNLGLLDFLNYNNDARIVGSVAHELIVKRDIDVHVLTEMKIDLVTKEVISFIINKQVKNFRYLDYRNNQEAIRVTIDDFRGFTGQWQIDIWITDNYKTTGFQMVEYLKEKLTNEKREIILSLKRYYNDLNLLHNGLSTQIYNGVIDNQVRTKNDFEEYLKRIGWELK